MKLQLCKMRLPKNHADKIAILQAVSQEGKVITDGYDRLVLIHAESVGALEQDSLVGPRSLSLSSSAPQNRIVSPSWSKKAAP